MIGQTVAYYRTIEKLGEGGIGEVYLARRTKLIQQHVLGYLSGSSPSSIDRATIHDFSH